MYYDMSTISNRDLQVLYEYRILKIPSHELTEILRAVPQEFQITEWVASEKEIEGYDAVYETHFELECGDHVPFLEFLPEDNQDWKWICDFIGIDVSTTSVTLYSATNKLTDLKTIIYQNLTLRQIESLLLDILDALAALSNNIDALESDISRVTSDNSNIGQRPEGLRNNLLKLQVSDDETKIVDAGVYIKKSELSRLYANPSQADLNGLLPAYKQAVDLRLITKTRHVVQNITAPRIQISGNGDLIVRNLKGQVIITKWTGTITIIDCSEVHIQASSMKNRCFLEQLRISRNSTVYLENYPHEIDSLKVLLSSTVRHWNGYVKSLDFVGPGCTYWCSQFVALPGSTKLPTPGTISAAVMDFRLKDIYGILSREIDKLLIINQKQVQNQVANADPPVQPYECLMNYKVEGGGVAPGPVDPGGGDIPDLSQYTVFPEYLQTVISDAYMGILPDDVQNIEENRGLAIMYGISLHEYGNSQVGWAYSKIFRTYLMAGCKSADGTFSHNLDEEAALVMHPTNPSDPWGFENLYTVSGLINMCKSAGSTEGMQNFYSMIKNPGTFGITDDTLKTICSYGATGNNSNTGCPDDGQFHYDFPGAAGIVGRCIYAYDSSSPLVPGGTGRITYYCSYYARDRWNSGNQNPNL